MHRKLTAAAVVAAVALNAGVASAKEPTVYPGQTLVCIVRTIPEPNGRPRVKMRCHVTGKRRKHGKTSIVLKFVKPPTVTGPTS